MLAASCAAIAAEGGLSAEETNAVPLGLQDYLQQVLDHNEALQAQMLDAAVNRHKESAQWGVFEPALTASVTREANKRTNSVVQQATYSGQLFFSERNTIYDGGIEQLIPWGGKVRLGATMSDLGNNVNPYPFLTVTNATFIQQYESFVGASLTQPLLKNGGLGATMAAIRLAALDSDIAFEQYRRQLMLTIYQAEGAYWNLYFAQEQVEFYDKSVSVAGEILEDARGKVTAGQGSELDVMQAQSALALRETKRDEAVQNYYDALGRLLTLTGAAPPPEIPASGGMRFRILDSPYTTNEPSAYQEDYEEAFGLNPDYLIERQKLRQERLRYDFAWNQLLPELDFKAAYGFNGLGTTPGDSWDAATRGATPSWSVGLELTMPLGGNIQGSNLYEAARLSAQEEYLKVKSVATQIGNDLNTAIEKARTWRQSAGSYQTVVQYNKELLQTELARLKAGTVQVELVLETEADLLDSRQDLANALTQYRDALLQIELLDGSILKDRGMDVTRDELRQQTERDLRHNPNFSAQNTLSPLTPVFTPAPPPSNPNLN
ncbi:MAG: TolC family protein [Verrucomicrobia bacterium]|nr:TolC family protein [Verrucomicrobiota bacterium]